MRGQAAELPIIIVHKKLPRFAVLLALPLLIILLYRCWNPNRFVSFFVVHKHIPVNEITERAGNIEEADSCLNSYIYVHDLPPRFNDDVIRNCSWLLRPWYDLCPYLENSGLGRQVEDPDGVVLEKSWFQTNQFVLEILFRNRMKNYRCLTNNSSLASAIFVPFYAGLDVGRYLWTHNASTRDALGLDMVKWVAQRPEWKRMWGRDHFFVTGRIASDFQRQSDNDTDWGSKLLNLPEAMNMTILSIESTSWGNEFAVPYPTHFHPSHESESLQWQNRMRTRDRRYLFAFTGAPRPGRNDSIRNEIIDHCLASGSFCKLLDCSFPGSKCENPIEVFGVFQDSIFCLQPPGDSPTRRSTFESILAGCIPVFFHPGSAYSQYVWFLPENYSTYSVFIPQNLVKEGQIRINETLLQVSKEEMLAKREEVIRLIPKVIYADFRSKSQTLGDAFDIAVKRVLERVENVRKMTHKRGNDILAS